MASPPRISEKGDALIFNFPHQLVGLRLDRWREVRHDVLCELSVRTSAPGHLPYLHGPVRWNLCSTSQRQQLIRLLKSRYTEADWEDIIERTARLALEIRREGEPVILIGVDDVPDRPTYRVDPLLLADQVNVLFGAPGTLKGWMALALSLTMQEGAPLLDLPLSGDRTRSLYLDFEFDQHTQARRIQALCAGAGMPRVAIAYKRCTGLLAEQIETVQRIVADLGAGFGVVDSVEAAVGAYGDGDIAGPFKRPIQAVRTIPITWLFIDHDAKGAERGRETPYGTRFKQAWSRNTWLIRKNQDAGASSASVGLWHDPTSNTAPRPPLGFRFVFNGPPEAPTIVTIHREDVRDVEGFSAHLTDWQKIERLLTRGPLLLQDIATEIGKTEAIVKARLNEKARKGRTLHLSDGRWALADQVHKP